MIEGGQVEVEAEEVEEVVGVDLSVGVPKNMRGVVQKRCRFFTGR